MAALPRVAAIDIGTNTVLLLVAEGEADHPVARLERATITRLGRGVDRTRRLTADAMSRTLRCLEDYAERIREQGAMPVDAVCTSAARDSENGDEFLRLAERALGTRPRIIDGTEEALLTFDGALTGLQVSGPVTVFDLGGGSTEIVRGEVGPGGAAPRVFESTSLDVGTVRLTERHVRGDPPEELELDALRADVARALAHAPLNPTTHLVGVAGTVTTLAAIDQRLSTYDPSRVHGARLSRAAVDGHLKRLATLPIDERRRVPGLDPDRADVIVAGAVLVLMVLDGCGVSELTVSDRGVRWGLARALLRR